MYDIQWAPTKLVHMTLGYTSVLCSSLVGAHHIRNNSVATPSDSTDSVK